MFSQESKLAVLESKLGIYEDLSREMLAKLEAAVDKISEGNSRIATILAKHDERIEQSIKTDELLIKMIDEVKEDFSKFRWQVGGIAALAIFLVGIIPTVKTLTAAPAPATIERAK
jgi:hypothetical protein